MSASFDIAIIGLGINIPSQVTVEGLRALSLCRTGFVNAASPDVGSRLNELLALLATPKKAPDYVSLKPHYLANRHRLQNYRSAAQSVLAAAKPGISVAYLTPGNPFSFDSVASLIVLGAKESGLKCFVAPGVSSLDTVLCDLRHAMAPGLQIFDAAWAVGAGVQLDARFACFLLQPSASMTSFPIDTLTSKPGALSLLKKFLTEQYGGDHEVSLVRSATGGQDANVTTTRISALDNLEPDVHQGASLFVPPRDAPSMDKQYVAMMLDRAQLARSFADLNRTA